MKQYLVIKRVGNDCASIVREFEQRESAVQFIKLLQESENLDYVTYELAIKVLVL